MRVNISVSFEVVEEIDAGPNSVDMIDYTEADFDVDKLAAMICAFVETAAQKARARNAPSKKRPAVTPQEPVGRDYPLDPEQD